MKKLMVLAMLVWGMNVIAVTPAPDLVTIEIEKIPTVISELVERYPRGFVKGVVVDAMDQVDNLPEGPGKLLRLAALLNGYAEVDKDNQ